MKYREIHLATASCYANILESHSCRCSVR